MKKEKKKIAVILTVVLILFCIFTYFSAVESASQTIKILDDSFESMGSGVGEFVSVELITMLLQVSAVVIGVLNALVLVLLLTMKEQENKVLIKALLITNIVFGVVSSDLVLILSVGDLVLFLSKSSWDEEKKNLKEIITEKNEDVKKIVKMDKEGRKLKLLKSSKIDYIWGGVLIVVYYFLLFIPVSFSNEALNIVYQILVYLFLMLFSIFVFRKTFTRDFKELSKNFKEYALLSLKYWGLMFLTLFVLSMIKVLILGTDSVTSNQAILNSLPLWFVAPIAMIYAPLVEESVFRGCFRRFIKNDVIFIVVSGLLFGLLHTFSETELLPFIINTLIYGTMGAWLAAAYVKTNNMASNMLLHFYQNTLSIVMMCLTLFV